MRALTVMPLLHLEPSPGLEGEGLDRYLADRVAPLVGAVAAHPDLKLSVHICGAVLERAIAARSEVVAELRALVARGQVEAVGGAWGEAVLAAIPEVDAVGQVQYTSGILREHLGATPDGAWSPLFAWDAALPRLLHAAGVRYTFADSSRFVAAGVPEDEVWGHFVAERLGAAVAVFPIDPDLGPSLLAVPAEAVGILGRAGARRGGAPVAVSISPGTEGPLDPVRELLAALSSDPHRLRTTRYRDHLDQFPSRGRVSLPGGLPAPAMRRGLPPRAAEDYALVLATLDAVGGREAALPYLVREPFEAFLTRYPEANLLHKRMLAVSHVVDRLRRTVREALRRDPAGAARARESLARACARMWRSQGHAPYWHGEHDGVYDRALRHRAWSDLLAAERIALQALGEAREGSNARLVDFDCDGHREVAAESAHMRGVWSRRAGGALVLLEIPGRAALLPMLRRHEEPYHSRLAWSGVQVVDGDGPDAAELARAFALDPVQDPLADSVTIDTLHRAAFMDHVLGEETTPAAFARRQYREVGDFLDTPWEGVNAGADSSSVALGRAGIADDQGRKSLIRIEKSFTLDPTSPLMLVRYRLVNRSFDPTRFWWGTEVNLDTPDADPGERRVIVRGVGAEALHPGASPFEATDASSVRIEGRGVAVQISFSQPLDVWYHPVEAVVGGDRGFRRLPLGMGFLFHRRFALWGAEESQLAFRVEVRLEPDGTP
ncbi:DUF1926 domain-containing protein [Myxococcota bacterium]|nr:DUF1926 domain-containing protein [Myxococcota bacterium]